MTSTLPSAPIEAGQTLTARSPCGYDCVFTARVLERKGAFATVVISGDTRRLKVRNHGDGDYVYALGRHSMSPAFRVA